MAKRLYLSLLALGALLTTTATSPSDLRVYLNPGHGGWGPNDRPMATVPYPALSSGRPDTCGFYESNTDLWKVARMRQALIDMGVKPENIAMSRWNNGPYPYDNITYHSGVGNYNRSLSEIAAEADAGNYDFFISVHSNADSDGSSANFPIFLYRGKSGAGGDYAAGSRDIALAMWPIHWMDEVDYKSGRSRTNPYVEGDISFMGSSSTVNGYTGYYGVLKHSVPGFISEGYFHTYRPARHRALNEDYCGQEGVRLARGVCDYFGLNPEATGYIMGTVKDKSQNVGNELYTKGAKSDDVYLPVNGAMVILYKGEDFVGAYKVDQNYNGVFVFEGLAPGSDYYLSVKAAGYANLERTGPHTVSANETTYPRLYLNSGTASGLGNSDLSLAFANDYADRAIAELDGKTVRRALMIGAHIIILAVDNDTQHTPHIYQVDPTTATVVREISTEGIITATNGSVLYNIADIAVTADGKLIAANLEETVYNTNDGTFRVYRWDSLDGTPVQWFTSPAGEETKSGYWYNAHVSRSIAYNGTSQSGYLLAGAVTISTSKQLRFVTYAVDGGALNQSKMTVNYDLDVTDNRGLQSEMAYGSDWQLLPSPKRIDQFIIDGQLIAPQEIRLNTGNRLAHHVMGSLATADVLPTSGNTFSLGHRQIFIAPASDGGAISGLTLYDMTSGLPSAEAIAITGVAPAARTCTYATALGSDNGANTFVYLLRDNLLSRWATTNEEPPTPVGDEIGTFAYGLSSTANADGSYTFAFTANNDAMSAALAFTDPATGEQIGSIDLAALNDSAGVTRGANSITVANADLPIAEGQTANWAVTLVGRNITSIARLNGSGTEFAHNRATVAVDDSPESDYFGRIYVGDWVSRANANNGLYAYNPDWTRINNTPYTGGQTFINNLRFDVGSDGTIFFTDWGDAHSGIFRFDPANLNAEATQFFGGTRNSDGLFLNTNSVGIGGSLSAARVVGTGNDTKLYTFDEDYITGSSDNAININNIGQQYNAGGAQWTAAPSRSLSTTSPNIINKGDLAVTADGGIWAAVFRSSNIEAYPPLLHFNANGTVDFSGHGLLDGAHDGTLAISHDEKWLAAQDQTGVTHLFAIGRDGSGNPTLTKRYSFIADARMDDNYVYGLAFDWGDNLLVSGKQLGIYSVPTSDNRHTTPAKRAFTVTRQTDITPGDVNADGSIDVLDINIVIGVILGSVPENSYNRRHDVNSDGDTNVLDINLIISQIM